MSERQEVIELLRQGAYSVSELSRRFGVSRKTLYKWRARYEQEGVSGLAERSRCPHHQPARLSAEIEAQIVLAREQHPAWGGRKLKRWLENRGVSGVGSPSTVTAVLRRYGLLDERDSAKHRAFQRFERPLPNALWQMDFKGDFVVGGGRCYPLTVLDDHARYLLGLRACDNQRRQTVEQQLTALFRVYGLPEEMLMDNGSPWGGHDGSRHTRLTVWLLRLGIRVSHGRPSHPQTQGKDERLHRTLGEELLSRRQAHSLGEWQVLFDQWRYLYNHQRPHEALEMDVPASRYQPSPRVFPETLTELYFPEGAAVRRCGQGGRLHYRGRQLRVGKAFTGLQLGVCPDPLQDGVVHVYLGLIPVRTFDLSALH